MKHLIEDMNATADALADPEQVWSNMARPNAANNIRAGVAEIERLADALLEAREEITRLQEIEAFAKEVAVYHDAPKDYEMDNGEAGVVVEWEPVWRLNNAVNPPASETGEKT